MCSKIIQHRASGEGQFPISVDATLGFDQTKLMMLFKGCLGD